MCVVPLSAPTTIDTTSLQLPQSLPLLLPLPLATTTVTAAATTTATVFPLAASLQSADAGAVEGGGVADIAAKEVTGCATATAVAFTAPGVPATEAVTIPGEQERNTQTVYLTHRQIISRYLTLRACCRVCCCWYYMRRCGSDRSCAISGAIRRSRRA
jgi:hypothetical protein